MIKKITPFLWFDKEAEEAMNFYVSIFKNSKVEDVHRGEDGNVFTCSFMLDGQEFMALNGGPIFKFNESISFSVECEDQAEIDSLWEKLTANGGQESQCGWLKDKFGLSWQIVPKELGEILYSEDKAKSQRAMAALMKMGKLDLKTLKEA